MTNLNIKFLLNVSESHIITHMHNTYQLSFLHDFSFGLSVDFSFIYEANKLAKKNETSFVKLFKGCDNGFSLRLSDNFMNIAVEELRFLDCGCVEYK